MNPYMDKNLCHKNTLPISLEEMSEHGWDQVDVVFVTGDAYVDHPSFAASLLGRWLEAHGIRVAILSQPDWKSCDAWRKFGKPRLCFAVSAGNMDSMVNHYTANRKIRNVDAYTAGGKIGMRPDRATAVYCQRAREAFPGVPVLAGGLEASLRRLAHYDYWSDKVRRSVLLDSKADLLLFGMGELSLLEVIRRLDAGTAVEEIRDIPGTAYRLGASEFLEKEGEESRIRMEALPESVVILPSVEEVQAEKASFAAMTKQIYDELNPWSGRPLFQQCGTEAVVVNPPGRPLSTEEMDAIYSLPFTRREHPSYGEEKVPALQIVQDSVQAVRGCYGGCAFCAIAAHEGKQIQCRSQESIVSEIATIASDTHFSGTITDIGGPTANMYGTGCTNAEARRACKRTSCLYPEVCGNLDTSHEAYLGVLRAARGVANVRNVFIASGIRTDLARKSPEFLQELVEHHVGGHLKVAPEHSVARVLACMRKPTIDDFDAFTVEFEEAAEKAEKNVYTVPYFIASHPGCDLEAMLELAVYLHNNGYRPQQVQDYLPAPFAISTCMYYTGLDPMTGEEVYVPRGDRERRLQRALLQYYKPENYHAVRDVLERLGREDLMGDGVECLIRSYPPAENGAKPERARAEGGGYRQRSREENAQREQRAMQRITQRERWGRERDREESPEKRSSDRYAKRQFNHRPERRWEDRQERRWDDRPREGREGRREDHRNDHRRDFRNDDRREDRGGNREFRRESRGDFRPDHRRDNRRDHREGDRGGRWENRRENYRGNDRDNNRGNDRGNRWENRREEKPFSRDDRPPRRNFDDRPPRREWQERRPRQDDSGNTDRPAPRQWDADSTDRRSVSTWRPRREEPRREGFRRDDRRDDSRREGRRDDFRRNDRPDFRQRRGDDSRFRSRDDRDSKPRERSDDWKPRERSGEWKPRERSGEWKPRENRDGSFRRKDGFRGKRFPGR